MKVDHGPDEVVDICFSKLMAGCGVFTVNVSLAVLPVLVTPAMVADTVPLVLGYVPALAAVTLTDTAQLLFAAIVPPASVIELDVLVTVPPHCEAEGALATVTPDGKVSEKATPESVLLKFGFTIVNVSVLVAPTRIGLGLNSFEMLGGSRAVRLAVP